VPTPLGPYNPDWAVLVSRDDGERLYFVVETKGGLPEGDLRSTEQGKIELRPYALQGLQAREAGPK
jgi:type III restriction enzyme